MLSARAILKYSVIGGGIIGTAISYKGNRYNIETIGLLRFGRAATTVCKTDY